MGSRFEFDHWLKLYSERTISMRSSTVRDLLSVTSRPDVISFAGGLPDTRVLPIENVIEATRRVMEAHGPEALQYGSSEGLPGLREQIVNIMATEGIGRSDSCEILLTNGSQQALELLAKTLIDPGDPIIVERPSYVGALNAFFSYQAEMHCVDMDDDGMNVDLLEKTLAEIFDSGRKPKFIYTVPTFHNPAGVTMCEERRIRLLKIAADRDILVIEDNPYSHLRFEGMPQSPLRARAENVIYLGTFSKIFSPGFRVGWVLAPKPIYEKLIVAKQAADLCSSAFSQFVLNDYLEHNSWAAALDTLIAVYKSRRDTMLEGLADFFPQESSWTRPNGGLFLWVRLPEYIDSAKMLAESISEAKVAYVPGQDFLADGTGQNFMRFNFSYPVEEQIYEGTKRIAKVIKKQMDLFRHLQP